MQGAKEPEDMTPRYEPRAWKAVRVVAFVGVVVLLWRAIAHSPSKRVGDHDAAARHGRAR